MIRRNSNRAAVHKQNKRIGTAVVELAFSLPLIVLIVFGSVEACNAIYLQQVVTEVAYQGSLEGIKRNSTRQTVIDRMQNYIDQTSLSGVTFEVAATDGTDFDNVTAGQSFRVTVTAPSDTMSLTMQVLSNLDELSGSRVANRQ